MRTEPRNSKKSLSKIDMSSLESCGVSVILTLFGATLFCAPTRMAGNDIGTIHCDRKLVILISLHITQPSFVLPS